MKHIYICSCDTDGGVYHYILSNGEFKLCDRLPLDRPMYMAIEGKKAYILLRETDRETHFGGLVTCNIADDGRLCDPCEPISTDGIVPCHLTVDNGTVYAVNYLSGNVVRLPDVTVTHTGKGVDPARQEAPHTHFICKAPDGYFLCCDLGLDTVFTYDKDLNEVAKTQVPLGHGARHLELSADGKTVYCVNEMGNTLSVFGYENGRLTLKDTLKLLPEFGGKSTAAAIRRVGDMLYISHRGADCVSRVKLGDKVILLDNTPCGGSSPRDILAVGDMLLCANELTDDVTVLDIGKEALRLSDKKLSLKHPLCICVAEFDSEIKI